jgi:hypothetical protein
MLDITCEPAMQSFRCHPITDFDGSDIGHEFRQPGVSQRLKRGRWDGPLEVSQNSPPKQASVDLNLRPGVASIHACPSVVFVRSVRTPLVMLALPASGCNRGHCP